MADARFAGRFAGAIALGAMAFTVYGSLVPFDFQTRDADDARTAFHWAMTQRWMFESRSDAIANVMLGVPLGFGLVGFLRAEGRGAAGDVFASLFCLPMCVAFAAAVEFCQLYLPERTTAGSDVLCQGFGSIIGMATWAVAGRWLVRQAEAIWSGSGAAGRLLIAYLVLLAFVQMLPMDLSASPRDLYRKLRDDVVYVPFSELNEANRIERGARLLQVCGLFLPVGVFARRGGWSLAIPLLLAIATEGFQLLVKSRVPSATDAVVGGFGVLLGWWLSLRSRTVVIFIVWMAAMLAISWQPFDLRKTTLPFDWTPGLPLERGHPLFALEDMLTKLILFGLGGALVKHPARAALAGLLVAGLCESGQMILGSHTPGLTDVLLGSLGMALGCRVRQLV
jgi:VanZ family protein